MSEPIAQWLDDALVRLSSSCATGRAPHSILVSGMPGIGVDALAQRLSRYFLCESYPSIGPSTCACKGCQLLQAGSHPDYMHLETEGAANLVKVDAIREMVEFTHITAHYGRKVVLISTADRMNEAASNALLKTLEEPNHDQVIILSSSAPDQLLPTIKSRVYQLGVMAPTEAQSRQFLKDSGIDSLHPFLEASMLQQPYSILALDDDKLKLLSLWLQTLEVRDRAKIDVVKSASHFAKEDLALLTEWWQAYLAVSIEHRSDTNNTLALHQFYQQLLMIKRKMLSGSNPNPVFTLESLLASWYKIKIVPMNLADNS